MFSCRDFSEQNGFHGIRLLLKLRCLENISHMSRGVILRFLLSSALLPSVQAQVSSACTPKIVGNQVVATAVQREAAGDAAQPPLTDQGNGFAWPDTPLGVIKTEEGYAFFGSDGAMHSRQLWRGH